MSQTIWKCRSRKAIVTQLHVLKIKRSSEHPYSRVQCSRHGRHGRLIRPSRHGRPTYSTMSTMYTRFRPMSSRSTVFTMSTRSTRSTLNRQLGTSTAFVDLDVSFRSPDVLHSRSLYVCGGLTEDLDQFAKQCWASDICAAVQETLKNLLLDEFHSTVL